MPAAAAPTSGLTPVQATAAAYARERLRAAGAEITDADTRACMPAGGWITPRPFGPERFVWGRVVAVHTIGGYQIVESIPYKTGGYDPFTLKDHPVRVGERRFHPYVDGQDTSHAYRSLDFALLSCVAWRAETRRGGYATAANSQAAAFMGRMIGLDS